MSSNELRRRPVSRARLAAALCILTCVVAACGREEAQVEPALVGVWEVPVPGGRWVFTIDSAGTYAFTNEAAGSAASHSGEFFAQDGRWSLRSTTMPLEDAGTYAVAGEGLELAGSLGSLRWGRSANSAAAVAEVAPQPATPQSTSVETPPASAPLPAPAATPRMSGGVPETIDPCLVVTASEAATVLGAPAVTTDRRTPLMRSQNDCLYRVSGDYTRTLSVRTFNGAGIDPAGYLQRRRDEGGTSLSGIGDGASLTYREATGLTSVNFVIGTATVEILMSGVSRDRSVPAIQTIAARAATRLTTAEAAFRVPGVEGFVGTWMVSVQTGDTSLPRMVVRVESDGDMRMQTVVSVGGTMLLTGSDWRIEDGFNQTPPAGQYRLRGDRLTLQGQPIAAELTRVGCGDSPKTVKPPYDLTRDLTGFLNGPGLGRLTVQETAADPFNTALAGLWEGEGTTDGRKTQVLAAFDDRGRSVIAVFPIIVGRLQASDGVYTLSIEGAPDSSGSYRFQGGTQTGSISVQEGDSTLTWTPYDPNRRPPYEMPIVGHCK